MHDAHEIKDRHLRRVMGQRFADPRTGEVRFPTVREAEAQIARVVERSAAEKREGRKPTQAKAAEPESFTDLRNAGCEPWSTNERGERIVTDEIRTGSATSNYRSGYDSINWKG